MTSSILKIGFALSKWLHLRRAYDVTVCRVLAVYYEYQYDDFFLYVSSRYDETFFWENVIVNFLFHENRI